MRQSVEKVFNILIISWVFFMPFFVSAQRTQRFQNPERELEEARELFFMKQYEAAKNAFVKVAASIPETYVLQKEEAAYYSAVCACMLYHKDAELLSRKFIDNYPESIHWSDMNLYLAHYRFNNGYYRSALLAYEKVDESSLQGDARSEYLFKKGYCYFDDENYDEAKPLLAEVKDIDCQYKNKALFYYSHILYLERNNRTALAGFQQLAEVDGYTSVVPYYIAQLYMAQGDYEKIVENADYFLEKSTAKRIPEINHLIARSYFELGKYKEAIPYQEAYFSRIEMANCQDYYELGYCYYQENQYDKAVQYLTKAIGRGQDELNQQVYFLIGDSYLKMGKKEFAANTFYAAYEIKKDPYLTEDALFTYAKLQYELSSNPFSNAITAFEKYMNEYPDAARRAEAEQYLSDIYLTTKNYNAAIRSLEKIEHRSAKLNEAYQRVLCFKGMELYNSGKYEEARSCFSKSMENNYDPAVYSQSVFWTAESYYQDARYPESVDGYNRFFASSGAPQTDEYAMAYYNAGYAHFKVRQYSHALERFKEFENRKSYGSDRRLTADLYNRLGDCYYMLSDLNTAASYYSKTIALNTYDVDYAIYQKAQALGSMDKNSEKITLMEQLRQAYPQSDYASEALLETANTYLSMGDNEKAAAIYRNYIRKYPKNQDTKEVMLKLGMVYYNTEDDGNALNVFKQVVQDYPKTKEASTALKSIENIYSQQGNVEEFFAYVRNVSFANITPEAQDSITFNSAADKYYNKQFVEAENGFDAYIKKFPEGVFSTQAHFYRAECEMKRSNFNNALSDYEYVIAHPMEQFEVMSLINAADIHFRNKNYRAAIDYYQRLQAKDILPSHRQDACQGMMKAYYADSNFNNAINVGKVLLEMDKLSDEARNDAHIVRARSAVFLKDWKLAEEEYTWLSRNTQSEYASEGLYKLAEIEYLQGNLDQAEKKIFEILVNIAYEYWSVKSYILLGDIYADKGNTFQAKHTYLSIIDNYDGEELRTQALNKYNAILAVEEAQNKERQQRQEELQQDNNNIELGNN